LYDSQEFWQNYMENYCNLMETGTICVGMIFLHPQAL